MMTMDVVHIYSSAMQKGKGCRMKIEKVNENQIRCTLTREDLASRELKISELAYGTEKAKNLFRDMMRQANFEFGFEAEDIPLMIEAIPLNAECIVLIITKVEDPEELDTRFSRFAPSVTEDNGYEDASDYAESASEEVLDLFRRLQTEQEDAESPSGSSPQDASDAKNEIPTRIFLIKSLRQAMEASAIVAKGYRGLSTLYKDQRSEGYLLLLNQGTDSSESFDKACNIISEYGSPQRSTAGGNAFLAEHYETLIRGDAIQKLGTSV